MEKYSKLSYQFFGNVKNNQLSKIEDCFVKRNPFVNLCGGCSETGSEGDIDLGLRRGRKRRLTKKYVTRRKGSKGSSRCFICYSTIDRRDGFEGASAEGQDLVNELITAIKTCEDEALYKSLGGVEVSTSLCLTCCSAAKHFIQLQKLIKRLEQEVFEMRAKFINAIKLSARMTEENSIGSRKQKETYTGVDLIRELLISTTTSPASAPEVILKPRTVRKPKVVNFEPSSKKLKNSSMRKPRRLCGGDYKQIKQVMENLISSVEKMVPNQLLFQPEPSAPAISILKHEPEAVQLEGPECDLITGDMFGEVDIIQDIPTSPASPPWSPPASPDPAWRPPPPKRRSRRQPNHLENTVNIRRRPKGIHNAHHLKTRPAAQPSSRCRYNTRWDRKLISRHPDLSQQEIRRLGHIRAESNIEERNRLEREFWDELKAQRPDLDLERNSAFTVNHPSIDKPTLTYSARRHRLLCSRHPDLSMKEKQRLYHILAKRDAEERTRSEREFWDELKTQRPGLDLERNLAFQIKKRRPRGINHPGHFKNQPAKKLSTNSHAIRRRELTLKYPDLSQKEILRLHHIRTEPNDADRANLERDFWDKLKSHQPDLDLERNSAFAPKASGSKQSVRFRKVIRDNGETILLYKNIEVKEDKLRQLWNCGSCDYSNKLIGSVSKHINMKHEDLSNDGFKCEFCNRVFYYNYLLVQHITRSHSTEPIVCEDCGATFSCDSSLFQHKRVVHLKIKPHICEHCGKSFGRKKDRDLHVRRHTGERPFVCHVCAQAFFDNQSMKAHIRKRHPEAAKHLPPKANPGRSKNIKLGAEDDL